MPHRSSAVLGLLLTAGCSFALDLDLNNPSSIKNATKVIAGNIAALYGNPSTPGIFSDSKYFWWEGGLAFDSLVNYWALTGDESYVNLTRDALVWQLGTDDDYMPVNQTKQMGNDDQSTWALAAMTAAEKQFPAPSGNLSWEQVAVNVFNSQVARWSTDTCNGGLRWQIFTFNSGYSYKNSISNGNFAQLAARLARFTGNETYAHWASEAVTWSQTVGLISSAGAVFSGSDVQTNCSQINQIQWTEDAGTFVSAAAYMSNITSSNSTWNNLLDSLVSHANTVFSSQPASPRDGVLSESSCAPQKNCDTDQLAFRAILARALANVNAFAAGTNATTRNTVNHILQASAQGAASQCSGGSNGTLCGNDWTSSKWDGTSGLGQDLSALEIILANIPITQTATANSTANGSAPSGLSPTNTTSGAEASHTQNTNGGASIMAPSALLSLLTFGLVAML